MILPSSYTKALKRYDECLFAERTKDGRLCVFRKTKRFDGPVEYEGKKFYNLVECKQLVFALTDTWTLTGVPRFWGIDRVLERVREIDTQANERLIEEIDAANERVEESKRRKFRNEAEAFWSENRKEFIKAVDSVYGTTTSLSKDEPKKRLKDRSIKNGNL